MDKNSEHLTFEQNSELSSHWWWPSQGAPMGCENADAQGASSYGAHVEGQRIKKPEEEHHPSCSLAATGEGEGAYGGAEDGGAAPEAADAPMSSNATSEPPMAR